MQNFKALFLSQAFVSKFFGISLLQPISNVRSGISQSYILFLSSNNLFPNLRCSSALAVPDVVQPKDDPRETVRPHNYLRKAVWPHVHPKEVWPHSYPKKGVTAHDYPTEAVWP